jgi:hypothetical protein
MIRTRTKKILTKAEQARQVKMLTAMGERLTRDNVIMFIAGVTPKVQVHNRTTLKEKLFTSTGVWGLLDVADVAEDLGVGVTQLLIDKVGE